MDETLVTISRSLIAFITLLLLIRILGKQQVGELTAFEYITGITIGSTASSLSVDLSTKPFPQFMGLVTWVVLVLLLQKLSIKHRWFSKLTNDQPTIVIQHGKILEQNLKKLRYRYDELMTHLRNKDIFDITQVEYALLEPNGSLTVLKKAEYEPLTMDSITKTKKSTNKLMTEVIMDGVIIEENLKNRKKTEEWLMKQLNKQGIKEIKEVSYGVILPNGQLYVDKFKDSINQLDIGDFKGPF